MSATVQPFVLPGAPGALRLVRRVSRGWDRIALLVVALVVWQLAAGADQSLFFPPPSEVLPRVREEYLSGSWRSLFLGQATFDHVVPSLSRMLRGFFLGGLLGIALGLLLGLRERARQYVEPMLQFGRAIPVSTLLGVVLVVFGTGDGPKVGLVATGALFPVLFNTMEGAANLAPVKLEAARVFKVPTHQRVLRLVLPAVTPKIFAGLRTGLSIALILMVLTEFYGALNGLGYRLVQAQRNFVILDLWAALVVLSALGVTLNGVLGLAERRMLRWHHGETGALDA